MADERRPVSLLSFRRSAPGVLAAVLAAFSVAACGNDPSQHSNSTPRADTVSSAPAGSAEQSTDRATPRPATPAAPASQDLVRVVINGEAFDLEPAVNQTTRYRGLGGRDSLPERGGMIFAFPFSERLEFVMRDCLIDIDIAYLNNDGRVLSMHEMVVEPRDPDESDRAYEQRLTRYPSRFPARFAVEVRGGLLRELGLEVGDVIEFDRRALKARAR